MTEQQPYDVLERIPGFELRRYPAHLVAEVEVESSFADAGNRAFGVLVGYISGRNSTQGKVAMTAPVVQERSTRIAMTAPVVQEPEGSPGRHVVSFVMPAEFSRDTLPVPSDPRIRIREVATQDAAATTFSGRWTEQNYNERLVNLAAAVERSGLRVSGPPRFARFDPPWTPWFLRRNEVVVPVARERGAGGHS